MRELCIHAAFHSQPSQAGTFCFFFIYFDCVYGPLHPGPYCRFVARKYKKIAQSMPSGSTSSEVVLVLSKLWDELPADQRKTYVRTFTKHQKAKLADAGVQLEPAAGATLRPTSLGLCSACS